MNLFSQQDSAALLAMLIMGMLFVPPIAIGVIIAARHNAKRARVPRKPEPLPPQAVLALARYHEEQLYQQEFRASKAALEKALDELANPGQSAHRTMWKFGIDPRKTNN
jgi:hypothetical protein